MRVFNNRWTIGALVIAAGAAFCGPTLAGAATADAWIGTWKLDPSKSDFSGETMTYSKSSTGKYRYSEGPASYEFAMDGKPYPAPYGRTATWTQVSDHVWDSISSREGAPTIHIHRELSVDGKTLNVTATGTNPDGTSIDESSVFQRVGGGTGLAGKWRSVKTTAGSPAVFIVSSPSPGIMRFEIPEWRQTAEGKLDGSDLPLTGPSATPGLTFSGKVDPSGKFNYMLKYQGKPDMYGVQTMAADGKSYTDVTWPAGKPNETTTGVYVKQ
jgi:hypothetical protein